MRPADIAVELRPRTAWEAIDLGLAMLQRWWRAVLLPHAIVLGAIALAASALGAWLDRAWVALLVLWWLKPLYDRVVLHVLSRAVFGEVQRARTVLAAPREWLGSGLLVYLLFRWWPDLARSFALPVRQLEGDRGRVVRERLSVLGRRTRASAVWLTLVCLHFEAVLYWSLLLVTTLLVPAKAYEARGFFDGLVGGAWSWANVAAYGATVLVIEPFYVAAGFALYLNRRTLLEGWDLEVALRRLAERHAALAAALLLGLSFLLNAPLSHAQKDPGHEIAEVLKAPEFAHERETMRWRLRLREHDIPDAGPREPRGLAFGKMLSEVVRGLLWLAIAAAIGYLAWQLASGLRLGPFFASPAGEPYRPPRTLFGMELAPESLPADVAAAAAELGRQGKARDALALLYRGALSRLVHQRGVRLLPGHTEAEVLGLAPAESAAYLKALVAAWRGCAYASRPPGGATLQQLADGFRTL